MENTILSEKEAVEYSEFKRSRREAEVAATVKRLIVDASRRETDKASLKIACESAKKLHATGVLVSPVNVTSARKLLEGSDVKIICLAGGTGESLPAVKRAEAKKAFLQGADEICLVPCYSQLAGGNVAYLKKEIKRVRRAVKRGEVTLSLEDHALSEREISLGVRAAREGGAHGVCVRGELSLVACALDAGAEQLRVDASAVENSRQLKSLFREGVMRASTHFGERISEELYRQAEEEAMVLTVPVTALKTPPKPLPQA